MLFVPKIYGPLQALEQWIMAGGENESTWREKLRRMDDIDSRASRFTFH